MSVGVIWTVLVRLVGTEPVSTLGLLLLGLAAATMAGRLARQPDPFERLREHRLP